MPPGVKASQKFLLFFKKPWVLFCFFLVLGSLIYLPAFRAGFEFDDHAITENTFIKHPERADRLWRDEDTTRFLTNLTFAINYRFFGLDQFWFHAVNVFLHCLNAFLLYLLALITFESPRLERSSQFGQRTATALFSALLFLAHPLQTQAVTYVIQRAAELATLFYLGTLFFYARFRFRRPQRRSDVVLCGLSAVLSVTTKPIVATLPLALLLYELCFGENSRQELKRRLSVLLLFLAVPAGVLSVMLYYYQRSHGPSELSAFLHMGGTISRADYLCTQTRVIRTYLRLLFFPWGQNLDYDYLVSRSLADPSVVASIFLIAAVVAAGFFLFRKHRLLAFGIFFFLIALLPESSFIPLPDVIFEHRLYLPMAGFALFFTSAVWTLFKNRKSAVWASVPMILLLSFFTYARNRIWQDPVTLGEDGAVKSPQKARAVFKLAIAYLREGDLARAEFFFKKVLELNPRDVDSENNLGEIYLRRKDKDHARYFFTRALEKDPFHELANIGLGVLSKQDQDWDGALAYYRRALIKNPNSAIAYNNIGNLYADRKQVFLAEENYRIAGELDPDLKDLSFNRGNNFFNGGFFEKAVAQYRKVLSISPDSETYENLAEALLKTGDLAGAEVARARAAELRRAKGG